MGIRIGVDIGGTTGRCAAYPSIEDEDALAMLEFTMTKSTEDERGDFDADYSNLTRSIGRLTARYGKLDGIGIAVAGKVDTARSMLTGAGNLGHWVLRPIYQMLVEEYGCDIVLGNDAEAGGLAEAHYDQNRGRNFWFAIHGTGWGGCYVSYGDDEEQTINIQTGEPGHQNVNPFGDVTCKCGQMNCLEAMVGGDGIERRLGKKPEELSEPEWRKEVIPWMAIGLRNQLTSVNARLVVFSGGLICNQPWLLKEVGDLLENDLKVIDAPPLVISRFGESAGTVGARMLLDRYRK